MLIDHMEKKYHAALAMHQLISASFILGADIEAMKWLISGVLSVTNQQLQHSAAIRC